MFTTSMAALVAIAPLAGAAPEPDRVIEVPGSGAIVTLWTEDGTPHYAISLDGETVNRAT